MADKALGILRYLPRINLNNIRPNPYSKFNPNLKASGRHGGGKRRGCSHKGAKQRMTYVRVGFESGNTPFYLRTPMEPYYQNHHLKRQYPPLSLKSLQLMIDTKRIDPTKPIDVGTLCSTHLYSIEPNDRHFGVQLTDEGIDDFTAKINIEAQHAPEHVIAAIERNGGVYSATYYDISSIRALINPMKFFQSGKPIPKRQLPPDDAIGAYTDPKYRGYLANPEKIALERLVLSQKYGYTLPDISKDLLYDVMMLRKDPRQIFYGLRPGWLVNLKDKTILEPVDPKIREFYEL